MSAQASCTCGRTWTGYQEAHCTVCHVHFSGVSAFDAHRPSYTGCGDPATLRRGGMNLMVEKKSPHGVTWTYNPELPGRGHKGRQW